MVDNLDVVENSQVLDERKVLLDEAIQLLNENKELNNELIAMREELSTNANELTGIMSEIQSILQPISTILIIINFIVIAFIIYKAYLDIKRLKEYIKNKEELIFKRSIFLGMDIFLIMFLVLLYIYGPTERLVDLILKIIPIIMGGIALIVGYLNFARKSNAELEYVISFDDANVGSGGMKFSLLNLKDRNIILYGLYIEFDNVSLLLPKSYPLTLSAYAHEDIEISNIVGFKIEDRSIQQDFKIIKRRYNFEHFSLTLDPIMSDYDGDQIIELIRNYDYTLKAITNLGSYIVNRKNIESIDTDISLSVVTESQVAEEMLNEELRNLFNDPNQNNIEELEKGIRDKKYTYFNDGMRFTLENQVNLKKHDGKYKIYAFPYKNMNTTR